MRLLPRRSPGAAPAPVDTTPPHPGGTADRAGGREAIDFQDRMGTVEFRVSERAHITVDGDSCRGCTTRACVSACPADLFVPTADGGILFNYEQCFECGTCYLLCNTDGAITWTYPDGGHGVVFSKS